MALIPPFFLDCVVAIGSQKENGEKIWIASGFLYGRFIRKIDDKLSEHRVYLVTNKHVIDGQKFILLRFNPKGNEPARDYTLNLIGSSGEKLWYGHPDSDIDVGVAPINVSVLKEHEIQFAYFLSESHVANKPKLIELGITEGDQIYTLGFPLGLIGGQRNFALARHGTIARITDALRGDTKEYLIDTFVFPGHSGGPVVTRPEAMSITGTKSQPVAFLIGLITGYVPYIDVAISAQTNRPRVTFEENSGLAAVIPIDFAQDAIERHIEQINKVEDKSNAKVTDSN